MINVSKRASIINASPMRTIAEKLEKAAADRDIISFGGGAPSFGPPKEVTNYLAELLRKNPEDITKYTSTNGLPRTRELISEDLKKSEEIEIFADDVCMSMGGSASLFAVMQATINAANILFSMFVDILPPSLSNEDVLRLPYYQMFLASDTAGALQIPANLIDLSVLLKG